MALLECRAKDLRELVAAAPSEAPPLLFLQHFRGNLDTWDPALVDRIAREREVVLLDNRGVGASTGAVPDNVDDMARDVLRFVDALGLRETDVLGYVARGYTNKEIAEALGLSTETVHGYLKTIYTKLHVRSRTEAAMKFRG